MKLKWWSGINYKNIRYCLLKKIWCLFQICSDIATTSICCTSLLRTEQHTCNINGQSGYYCYHLVCVTKTHIDFDFFFTGHNPTPWGHNYSIGYGVSQSFVLKCWTNAIILSYVPFIVILKTIKCFLFWFMRDMKVALQ